MSDLVEHGSHVFPLPCKSAADLTDAGVPVFLFALRAIQSVKSLCQLPLFSRPSSCFTVLLVSLTGTRPLGRHILEKLIPTAIDRGEHTNLVEFVRTR